MDDAHPLDADYPFQKLLGYHLTEWREGFARLELPLAAQHMNRSDIPHGGVHATLLDTAMGYAGGYADDPDDRLKVLTLSLTVNFIGQARGTRLIAEGRVGGGGRRSYFGEGRVTDETGALIATGSGVFRYRRG